MLSASFINNFSELLDVITGFDHGHGDFNKTASEFYGVLEIFEFLQHVKDHTHESNCWILE